MIFTLSDTTAVKMSIMSVTNHLIDIQKTDKYDQEISLEMIY